MNTHKNIKQVADEAIKLAECLLNNKPNKPGNIECPTKAGVYLIYCGDSRKKGIIYVGESDNINRRLRGHLSAGESEVTSFRGRLKDAGDLNLKYGPEMKNWVTKNCEFALDDDDMYRSRALRKLVEAILVVFLKDEGEPLLNKS